MLGCSYQTQIPVTRNFVQYDEVRLAVGSGAGVEDLGDSGMIHAPERLTFRFEALQENVVGHTGANELQR